MKKYVVVVLFLTIAWIDSGPVLAHHGAASFDTTREVTLTGTVTEWIWANPHCFIKFDAKDDTGAVRNWVVETQNPTDMTRRGWARTSFRVGDAISVTMQVVKSGAPVGRVRSVILANGQTLNAGAPPGPPSGSPGELPAAAP